VAQQAAENAAAAAEPVQDARLLDARLAQGAVLIRRTHLAPSAVPQRTHLASAAEALVCTWHQRM